MRKTAIVLGLMIIGAGLFGVKYFTMLLDSKDSAIVINKAYKFKDDYQDKQKLAKAVDNIFIGEVVTEAGHEKYTGQPNTQFKVMITQNIKGALLGDITVNQEGGYYKKNGRLYLLTYEKMPLLKEKQMYIFALTNTKKGYFQMMPKYGAVPLDNEEQKMKQIAAFKQAMGEE